MTVDHRPGFCFETIIWLLACLPLAADEMPVARLRVTHCPPAAYVGEPATFVVTGPVGKKLEVWLDQEPLISAAFGDRPTEINLKLDKGGRLRFATGDEDLSFQILLPGPALELRVADGILWQDGVPVVLLVYHRHPPKHDRTWETVKVARALLGEDQRPTAGTVGLWGRTPAVLTGDPKADLADWQWTSVAAGMELPAMIADLAGLKRADAVVLVPSAGDLELGTPPLLYRMQLEWLLQALDRKRFPNVFLVPPTLTPHQAEAYRELGSFLYLAAAGNHAFLVDPATARDRLPTLADWRRAVNQRIQKHVALE